MNQLILADTGSRFYSILLQLGFVFSATKEISENRSYVIRDFGDKDPIHNPISNVEMVIQGTQVLEPGLKSANARRGYGRQNWKIAQDLPFKRV